MKSIGFEYNRANMREHEMCHYEGQVALFHHMLHEKSGLGEDGLGWLEYPKTLQNLQIQLILRAAERIQTHSDAFLVIGIGGSYLGARAGIEMLGHTFYNLFPKNKRKTPEIYYVGHTLSATYFEELIEVLENKEISLCVISKSGTTVEPAIAFRLLRAYMEKKYGVEEATKRIYVITDQKKGSLRLLAEEKGYETFAIPRDIGGRYSILTAVGLLPMAVGGLNIEKMLAGAKEAYVEYDREDLAQNPCYQYAVVRNILYAKGKDIEILAAYEPHFRYFGEWWKQLFAESEGKDGKGIFPATVEFSADLHSMGQLIQDGKRNIFETILYVEKPRKDRLIGEDKDDLDGLNFLSQKSMGEVNHHAYKGTMLAHVHGGVPGLVITIPSMEEYCFGKLVYFFQKSCAMSACILGVNPFEQRGVEEYKRNMYALLGKPGYEEFQKQLGGY